MADFDEYRKRWVYECKNCGNKVVAFRDCGEQVQCRCGQFQDLTDVIEPKHIEGGDNGEIAVHTFKPYFDVTLGKEITSEKEIKDYCKKNNCVYAGDKELTQQCESNKRYNEQKFNRQFENGLTETILRSLN